jgi:cyclomaltodextrinase
MRTGHLALRTRSTSWFTVSAVLVAGIGRLAAGPAHADSGWPPAPPLKSAGPAEDAEPLPPSVTAEPLEKGQWKCTFRFQPKADAQRVALVGSFNSWDRGAHPMQGPDANGQWQTTVVLETGVHQYKFVVNNEDWYADPANTDQVPDGFGKFNSVLRLGRLTRMAASTAQVGDGQIDVSGLAHQPHLALYVQPTAANKLAVRYRTLSHDVREISLATKSGNRLATARMSPVCEGPLFTYWEADVELPEPPAGAPVPVRGLEYTFVLDDGAGQFCDPYGSYYYTFTPNALIRTPEWARHAIWYEIMLDRFRNGDPANDHDPVRPWTSEWFTPSEWEGKDGQTFYQHFAFSRFYGGDIAGLESQLDYLKSLGVNALYLTPVFKAPSYHKYDVQNYLHIDDEFGVKGDYEKIAAQEDLLDPNTWKWTASDQRFLAFLRKAHEAGFRVIIDAVFNHVGKDHPAFVDVVSNGRQSRFADWFDVTSWEPFAYRGWAGFAHQPQFRKDQNGFASPSLKKHLFAVTRRWMDPDGDGNPTDGVDGWRLDVPSDIARPFWAEWRQLVKQINPEALIVGDVWNRAEQWLDGEHFDAVANYEFARTAVAWIFDRQQKLTASAAAARFTEILLAYPSAAAYALPNLISSHDTDRLASMAQNPDREYDRQNRVQDSNPQYDNSKPSSASYARARLAALLQMTWIGAPQIYYGDEVGMWGADDPTNRKPMLWKDLEPYEKPEENAVLTEQLEFYRRAAALRTQHAALRTGSFQTVHTDDAADVWAFVRSDGQEHLLVVLNASESPRSVQIHLPARRYPSTWKGLLGIQGELTVTNETLSVNVPALSGVVLSGAER